jgi:hypothetical protein
VLRWTLKINKPGFSGFRRTLEARVCFARLSQARPVTSYFRGGGQPLRHIFAFRPDLQAATHRAHFRAHRLDLTLKIFPQRVIPVGALAPIDKPAELLMQFPVLSGD